MMNLDSILKSRDITLLTKACVVKALVFPVVIYGCESWIIKKAEGHRIDAFCASGERETLESPLDTLKERVSSQRRSNQSILKEINPKCSLEGLILKQKLQYFGHLL